MDPQVPTYPPAALTLAFEVFRETMKPQGTDMEEALPSPQHCLPDGAPCLCKSDTFSPMPQGKGWLNITPSLSHSVTLV